MVSFICRDSEVVKRAGLKIPSLSGFGGSNPLPCTIYAPVAQPGLEHLRPKERVVGSNPIGRIIPAEVKLRKPQLSCIVIFKTPFSVSFLSVGSIAVVYLPSKQMVRVRLPAYA